MNDLRVPLLLMSCFPLIASLSACVDSHGYGRPECDRELCQAPPDDLMCSSDVSTDIFERRIKPLIEGNQTCNQCHLNSIDLSTYFREDACTSMACLVERGQVNLGSPYDSKILSQIQMAMPDGELVTEAMIQAEHDGFLEWIEHSSDCHYSLCGDIADPCGEVDPPAADGGVPPPPPPDGGTEPPPDGGTTPPPPTCPPGPYGCCDPTALLASYTANIWNNRGGCAPCHDPLGAETETAETNFIYADPMASLLELLTYETTEPEYPGLPLVDCSDPLNSPYLMIPLRMSDGGWYHGGGDKAARGQPRYVQIETFIQQYCDCVATPP